MDRGDGGLFPGLEGESQQIKSTGKPDPARRPARARRTPARTSRRRTTRRTRRRSCGRAPTSPSDASRKLRPARARARVFAERARVLVRRVADDGFAPSSRRRRSRDVVNPSQHRATANSNGADEPHPSTHPSTQLPERDAATQLARLASTQLAQLLAARFGVFEAAPNPTAYARIITIAHDFCVRTLTQYGAVHHGHLGPPTELWALQRDHPPAHGALAPHDHLRRACRGRRT